MELKKIKQLINLMKKNDINELEIEEPNFRIKLKTEQAKSTIPNISQIIPPYSIPQAVSVSLPEYNENSSQAMPAEQENKNQKSVKSPMVGTFYRSPGPDSPSFAKEGDIVKQGQTLCIIEAMKLMNEIESPYDGKIVSILVKNAQPVEYDELLFLIETA